MKNTFLVYLFLLCSCASKKASSQDHNYVVNTSTVMNNTEEEILNKKIYTNYKTRNYEVFVLATAGIADWKNYSDSVFSILSSKHKNFVMIYFSSNPEIVSTKTDFIMKKRISDSSCVEINNTMKVYFSKADFINGFLSGINYIDSIMSK